MATITKTTAGTFKAIIRKNGRIVKTKTFQKKSHARTWAARIEGDSDALAAFGMAGSSMKFSDLIDEYHTQWTGKSDIDSAIKHLRANLGDFTLMDIDKLTAKAMLKDLLITQQDKSLCRGIRPQSV